MKIWFLAILLLSGCASSRKEEKAFQESLDKPNEVKEIKVEAPPKLLEKFEPEKLPEEKKIKKTVLKTEDKVIVVVEKQLAKPLKPDLSPAEVPAPIEDRLPKDYPPEMLKLNQQAKSIWEKYKPNHTEGEKIFMDIHYLGMTVGKIMITNRGKKMINGKEVWHFHARFKSAPFYSKIYELDDTVDTYVTTDQFLSLRYSLIQRESSMDIDDLQLHDRDKLKTHWFYKRKKSDGSLKEKQEKHPIPYFSIDPFSVVYFFQGLPLKKGDVYNIPLINKGKILMLKSEVEGTEVIETEIGKKKAIRLHATTKYTGDTLKSGDMYFWFTADDKKTFLKAQAKIKLGSVTADIAED